MEVSARWDEMADRTVAVGAIDSLLRGIGQVMFQNNPLTGLLFLIGIFYNSITFGVAGVIGLAASTLTAVLLGIDSVLIRAGLFGFNGILVGIAFALFLGFDLAVTLYIVVAAAASTVVMAALSNLLASWEVAPLTAPFVLVTWAALLPVYVFDRLDPTELIPGGRVPVLEDIGTVLAPSVDADGGWTVTNLGQALFRGVGQVMFEDNLITGIIFVIAILVNSRISAAMAVLGSAIGIAVAGILGAAGVSIYHGLYGFNAVLCAIAIGGVFYVFTWRTALYASFCAVAGTILMGAIAVTLTPFGLSPLTGPFVLATWFFLLPKGVHGVMKAVPLADVGTPEASRALLLGEIPRDRDVTGP